MMIFGLNIHEKELRKVTVVIERILENPENPKEEIDEFIRYLYDNKLDILSKGDNIWSEVLHLADELESYMPYAQTDDMMAGYFGQKRALKLTKNCLQIIHAVLPRKKEWSFSSFFKFRL